MNLIKLLISVIVALSTISLSSTLQVDPSNVVTTPLPSFYSSSMATTSVWFSAQASCGKDLYPTMKWVGPTSSFVYKGTLYDKPTDTQGYYGIQPDQKLIWVVYRGTISVKNELDDAEVWLVDAEYGADCPECKLHNGFSKCYNSTRSQALQAVATLVKEYPTYSIAVAGHSLGGAIANIAAADLIRGGYKDVTLYTFGSPRVGNAAFSDYFSTQLMPKTSIRITHFKDPVPHVPFTSFHYVHVVNEVYESEDHTLQGCVGTDDPACSSQWSFAQCSTQGACHTLYLNVSMHCPSAKKIDPTVALNNV